MYTCHFLKIHYLSGAILIQNDGKADSLLYTYSDAQGSLIALTDASGNVVEKYAYDPWGARRNPDDWTQKDTRTKWIINRGYTGHEHIDAFGIINMNGRVYDPATGMFFSPDPTLTDAGNWLDYNRYSYCLNNPFRYTDPSGYSWWAENWQPVVTTVASIAAGAIVVLSCGTATPILATGMLAGTASGFTSGVVGTAVYGGSFDQCMNAGIQNAILGGISGAITAGIGTQFGAVGVGSAFNPLNELARAGAHALAQGAFAAVRGGDFWQGAESGFVSSLGGSAAGGLGITDFVGTVAITSAMGGIGAVIGGAKSSENILFGIVAGAMVGALNFAEEASHQEVSSDQPDKSDTSLEDIKNDPPNHPEYESPKGGDRKVKNPNGNGYGWIDKKGRVWVPTDHGGSHAPHWDREEPGGGYENIYPYARPTIEPNLRDRIGQLVGLTGTALTIYLIVSEGSRLFPPRNLIPVP